MSRPVLLERPSRAPARSRVHLKPQRPSGWRAVISGPAVALATLVAAFVGTGVAGVPLRDPDNDALVYVLIVVVAVAALVALDVAVRAGWRPGSRRPSRAALRSVRRERWTRRRMAAVGLAIVSFYLAYMAYRNLKAVVPLLRPGELFDGQLADVDRALFGGHDPAVALHAVFGTGIATQVFSTLYVGFIVFLPLSLALALVFSRDLQGSLFYTTALSVNWLIGAGSYLLLPSLGPIYADPSVFAHLPASEVAHLQHVLMAQRVEFLQHPSTATPQAIAAFASLHISMSFTAAVAAHLLGLRRWVKVALWAWLGLTFLGTIYLGWHYVVDDLAGLAIGAAALLLARLLTGLDLRSTRRERTVAAAPG